MVGSVSATFGPGWAGCRRVWGLCSEPPPDPPQLGHGSMQGPPRVGGVGLPDVQAPKYTRRWPREPSEGGD